MLQEILEQLKTKTPEQLANLAKKVEAERVEKNMRFIPNPGPQSDAYFSEADILLYGGEPGGGKTALLIGLGLNEHDRSLIVRKQYSDLVGVMDNAKTIIGTEFGFVGGQRPKYRKPDGGVIHFEGIAQGGKIDTGKQGNARDFIGVDEGAQLPEAAIRLMYGWNRPLGNKNRRCRMVIASNPPVDSTGDWMIDFFGPWLYDRHPHPAKDGELRWYIMGEGGKSMEVESRELVTIDGIKYKPHSRTFIRASVEDNPYLNAEEYRGKVQAMPEPMRTIMMTGNFMLMRQDLDFQVCPTAWVIAAENRWTEQPPVGFAMTAMSLDPAGGGADAQELIYRYGGWYSEPITVQGKETDNGSETAATVVKHRRDKCGVVVDVGGGYGGAVRMRLADNGIEAISFNGAHQSLVKSADGQLGFYNKRAEAWWRFREALDPNQEGGSTVALPPIPELRADLTAPTWELTPRGIKIESKDDIRKRLGRSPGKGDVVVMCLSEGNHAIKRAKYNAESRPKVVLGHMEKRRTR